MENLRNKLKITDAALQSLNDLILDPENSLINDLLSIVEKYGGVEEINRKATEARKMENLLAKLQKVNSSYVDDIKWLQQQRDEKKFVSAVEYQKDILGSDYDTNAFDESLAVTLELSAIQYFPFLIDIAKRAIENKLMMPRRIIRVRMMKEQEKDGDLVAMAAAMQIIGVSYVETLDTKGTAPGPDGLPVNVHLGGPDTITGYFGGVGQPNDFGIKCSKIINIQILVEYVVINVISR